MENYEKGVALGHGTFGSVYKARHKEVRPQAVQAAPRARAAAAHAAAARAAGPCAAGAMCCLTGPQERPGALGPVPMRHRPSIQLRNPNPCCTDRPAPPPQTSTTHVHAPTHSHSHSHIWIAVSLTHPQTGQAVAIKKINIGSSNQVRAPAPAAGRRGVWMGAGSGQTTEAYRCEAYAA